MRSSQPSFGKRSVVAPNVAQMNRPAPTVDELAPTPKSKLFKILLAAMLAVVAPIFLLGSAILSRLKARNEPPGTASTSNSTRLPIITGMGGHSGSQQTAPSSISRGGFGGTASGASGASGT
jgi:uncharacterized membrane protein YgcG